MGIVFKAGWATKGCERPNPFTITIYYLSCPLAKGIHYKCPTIATLSIPIECSKSKISLSYYTKRELGRGM